MMATPKIKKILDPRFSSGVAYTMHAAFNRNREHIDHLFFLYGLMKSASEYLSKIFGQKEINKACLELAQASGVDDDDDDYDVDSIAVDTLNDLKFSESVSKCVEVIRKGKNEMGLLGAIAAICAEHRDAMGILEEAGIKRHAIEKAAMSEISAMNPQNKTPKKEGNTTQGSSKSSQSSLELSNLCTDLTALATQGKLSRTFCREREIDNVILSLMRKIKNNPLLLGDPGVGKTAIIEGLAYRIVNGDIPKKFSDARIYSLEMSALVSGTSLRGQFEERLKAIVEKICSEDNALLFIDEVHMLVGAGDNSGVMDAGNVLKPYLARGELHCIGATTFRDYNRTIKKDGALSRRFHNIVVHEVNSDSTLDILRGLKGDFEDFHGCKIEKKALEKIVQLSSRYLSERRFPDKAIDCLDDACARAAVAREAVDVEKVELSVASIANVPVSMLRNSDVQRLSEARPELKQKILGNDSAIDEICDVIGTSFAIGKHSGRTLCSMIVHGPSGLGKKTVLKELSHNLFGTDSFFSINGAEYVEPHSISKIIGSPPGYVGYNEESNIVRQIRRCPHSMILVEGVRKMNYVVREHIFDMLKLGEMTTGEGDKIDLGNAIFVFLEEESKTQTVGFGIKNSDSSSKMLDHWSSYGIFESVDGVVKFEPVKSLDILKKIALMQAEEFDEWDGSEDVEEMIDEILKEHIYASPSKIRREVRHALERLAIKDKRINSTVNKVK